MEAGLTPERLITTEKLNAKQQGNILHAVSSLKHKQYLYYLIDYFPSHSSLQNVRSNFVADGYVSQVGQDIERNWKQENIKIWQPLGNLRCRINSTAFIPHEFTTRFRHNNI